MRSEMDAVNRATLLLLLASIAACSPREFAGRSEPREWVEAELGAAGNGVAVTLDWSDLPGAISTIDGATLGDGFDRAKLSPGDHVIEYEHHPAEFGVHPKGTIEVQLDAGHSYELRTKLCYWCSPRKHAEWIVDTSTNELVWGALPTWPSWYW